LAQSPLWSSFAYDVSFAAVLFVSFALYALTEEAARALAIHLSVRGRASGWSRVEILLSAAMIGLGVALLENLNMAVRHADAAPSTFALLRGLIAVPGHAAYGAIIGYFVARRHKDGRGPGIVGGAALAGALHGTFDLFTNWPPARELPTLRYSVHIVTLALAVTLFVRARRLDAIKSGVSLGCRCIRRWRKCSPSGSLEVGRK
jgi:RsiW-degrading membrane proteinase PrsW (M82 family)